MEKDDTPAAGKLLHRLKNTSADRVADRARCNHHRNFHSRGQALSKLTAMLPTPRAQFDLHIIEKRLLKSKGCRRILVGLLSANTEPIQFASMSDDLRKISVELRYLELRDSVRPLNRVSSLNKSVLCARELG